MNSIGKPGHVHEQLAEIAVNIITKREANINAEVMKYPNAERAFMIDMRWDYAIGQDLNGKILMSEKVPAIELTAGEYLIPVYLMEANCAPWLVGFDAKKNARMTLIMEDTYRLAGIFRDKDTDMVTEEDLLMDEPECEEIICLAGEKDKR